MKVSGYFTTLHISYQVSDYLTNQLMLPVPDHLMRFRQQLVKFVIFTDEEWDLFTQHLYFKELKKKDLFIATGKVCSEIGFMLSGTTRFYVVKDGIEISNYFCFKSDLITSYASFLRRQPSLVSIEALEDCELICFSCTGLYQMMEDPRMVNKLEHMGRLIAEYLICCYEDRMMTFLTLSPEERYLSMLKGSSDLLQRIPQHHIANYLGITPVSLSRIRKRIALNNSQKKVPKGIPVAIH